MFSRPHGPHHDKGGQSGGTTCDVRAGAGGSLPSSHATGFAIISTTPSQSQASRNTYRYQKLQYSVPSAGRPFAARVSSRTIPAPPAVSCELTVPRLRALGTPHLFAYLRPPLHTRWNPRAPSLTRGSKPPIGALRRGHPSSAKVAHGLDLSRCMMAPVHAVASPGRRPRGRRYYCSGFHFFFGVGARGRGVVGISRGRRGPGPAEASAPSQSWGQT